MSDRDSVARLEIRACKVHELAAIVERFDREFIFNKQRTISLAKRFSNVLSLENLNHIRLATLRGNVCGALSTKIFEFIIKDHIWHGAMIGMVWVDPQYRGMGVGSNLVHSTTQFLYNEGVDFAVLWTGIPDFYERSGWLLKDHSLFGELKKRRSFGNTRIVSCMSVTSANAEWLEFVRSIHVSMRIKRKLRDYYNIPIPAVDTLCFSVKDGEGFALVGRLNNICYFYEMVASPSLWEIIWTSIADHFERIFVNIHSDDPFVQWLNAKYEMVWQPQSKAMWHSVSSSIRNNIFDWYIPYFDRI